MLQCYHESNNDYDSFSKKKRVKKQISRNFTTKFLLGTTVTATRSSTHYKRYSLVQEGVQIICVVNAKLIGTKKKKILAK